MTIAFTIDHPTAYASMVLYILLEKPGPILTPLQKSVPEGRRPKRATAMLARWAGGPLGRKEMTKKSTHWK